MLFTEQRFIIILVQRYKVFTHQVLPYCNYRQILIPEFYYGYYLSFYGIDFVQVVNDELFFYQGYGIT